MATESRIGDIETYALNHGPEETENELSIKGRKYGSRKINELSADEIQEILENFGVVGAQGNTARLTRILIKVLATTQLADIFGISGKSETAKIDEIICPAWMRRCRIKGVSESDLKMITVELAKTDKEFENISVKDMEAVEITSGSKGVVLKILRK